MKNEIPFLTELKISLVSLYIFYCHKLQQWGGVSSSRNIYILLVKKLIGFKNVQECTAVNVLKF